MAIPIDTVKAWITALVPPRLLIDLTNQYNGIPTVVNTAYLETHIQRAMYYFEAAVGQEPFEKWYHDQIAIESLVMALLYTYAQNLELQQFHLNNAQHFLRTALERRRATGPVTLSANDEQSYTNRSTFIDSLPTAIFVNTD